MKKTQPLLSLKPTQFSMGVAEIERKVEELEKLGRKGIKQRLRENPIPVVISPHEHLYIIDHHHALYSYWCVGITKVPVKVLHDFSKSRLSFLEFWKEMAERNWAHLFDQFGDGPRSPLYLANDIRGLGDDPYRSLAWMVREQGGYEKSEEPFSEFRWASFFREHKLLHQEGRRALLGCIKPAVKLARSPAARGMPGYLGRSALKKGSGK